MPWTLANPPDAVKNKPKHVIEACVLAANAALAKGLTEEEAIFACLSAAKRTEAQSVTKTVKRPVPQHIQALLERKIQEPETQKAINSVFLGKSALPADKERTLVQADFNSKNQLVLTFDTGEKITTSAPNIEQNIEQYLSVSTSGSGATGLTNPLDYIEFNQAAGVVADTGQLTWNAVDGTLDLGLLGGNVTLQIGQEQIVRFVNHTSVDFAEMQVVRIVGAQGNRLSADLAQSNSDVNSNTTFAVVTEPILKNQQGYATVSGLVRDVNTSAFPEGSVLYLSPTVPGGITNVVPVSPSRNIRVGYCVRSHATVGSVFVHIVNDTDLNELHDVLVQVPQNGEVLMYEASSGLWKNKATTSSVLSTVLVNTDYTVVPSDYTMRVDCSSSPVVLSLPTVASATGRVLVIKKVDSSDNPVQITANGSEQIDGVNTAQIYVQHLSLSLQSNGSSWDII